MTIWIFGEALFMDVKYCRTDERERENNGGTGHKREIKWQFHIA